MLTAPSPPKIVDGRLVGTGLPVARLAEYTEEVYDQNATAEAICRSWGKHCFCLSVLAVLLLAFNVLAGALALSRLHDNTFVFETGLYVMFGCSVWGAMWSFASLLRIAWFMYPEVSHVWTLHIPSQPNAWRMRHPRNVQLVPAFTVKPVLELAAYWNVAAGVGTTCIVLIEHTHHFLL